MGGKIQQDSKAQPSLETTETRCYLTPHNSKQSLLSPAAAPIWPLSPPPPHIKQHPQGANSAAGFKMFAEFTSSLQLGVVGHL